MVGYAAQRIPARDAAADRCGNRTNVHHRHPYLDNDLSSPVQLAELIGYSGTNLSFPRDVVLRLEVAQGAVDAADLAVRPTLNTVTTAQPLEGRDRDVHRLRCRTGPEYSGTNSVRPPTK